MRSPLLHLALLIAATIVGFAMMPRADVEVPRVAINDAGYAYLVLPNLQPPQTCVCVQPDRPHCWCRFNADAGWWEVSPP